MAKYGFSGQTDVDLSTGHYTDKSPAPPKLASVSPIIDGAARAAVPPGQERSPLDNG